MTQTEIERGFTLLARSDQWANFIGDKVNAETIDRLVSAGNIKHAVTLLQAMTTWHLLPTLMLHILCAREAYLSQCNTEVIEMLFTKEVKE